MELRADPPALRDLGAAGDRMAHQLLVGELNRLYPDDDVRSEEGLEHVAGHGPPLDHRPAGRHPRVPPARAAATGPCTWRWPWAAWPSSAPWPCRRSTSCSAPGSRRCCRRRAPARRPRVVVSRSRPPDVAYEVTEAIGGVMVPMGSAGAKIAAVDPRRGRGLRARRWSVRVGLVRPGGGGHGERAACQPARRGAAALRRPRRVAARPRRVPPGVCRGTCWR